MAAKRKISIRKILQVLLTIVVSTCCIVAMVSASRIESSKTVSNVVIHFKNDKKYHFIEEKEIMDLAITGRHIDLAHTPVSRLDIRAMERVIMADPWVANAQVYIDNERVLHMYVTQRIPVARLFQQDSKTCYLDTTLSMMPLSPNYIYYTTVITNVPELGNDSASWAMRKDIISLARTIQADSFWSAQVSQVIVDSAGMYELVPILGDHRIIFGDVTDAKEKLKNLFVFYSNVLNRIGWDKYQTLDVRFNGQVVASPSLPYSGPVDRAVTNMNWINSIVETEARNDAKDSVHAAGVKANNVKPAVAPAKVVSKAAPVKVSVPKATPANVVPKVSAKVAPKPAQANGHVVNMVTAKKAKVPVGKKKDITKVKAKETKKEVKPKYIYPDKEKH